MAITENVQEGYVSSETHAGVTTIEFYHPQSNAMPTLQLEKLAQAIHFAGTHDETKVIVLKSAGDRSFCAGASFDELMQIKTPAEGEKFFSGFATVINNMRKCPKFIIARVQGKCVGGGVGIACAADYAIGVEGADIKLSELAVGIGPFVVGPAVERKIGTAAYSALAIDATMWRNSDWAKKKGMFAEVHENIANMDESVKRLANTLAHSNPEAMAALKKVFWQGTEHWDTLLHERALISGKLILSEFSKNAIAKFKAK
ncbi:enoyl-CoA hydratase/isomerase family protein [Ferruginibacter yonginensis]|uniref:Enoyl-CoA hydratase/isomerase family protein n=1 Tax=Ferruginibacter yonginensis TaxID=1310416 RepID=A0ABV8QT52_9BACT